MNGLSLLFSPAGRDGPLQPLHKTVFDFLSDREIAKDYFADKDLGHGLLAQNTLQALSDEGLLKEPTEPGQRVSKAQVRQYPLLWYSVKFGHLHLAECGQVVAKSGGASVDKHVVNECTQGLAAWQNAFVEPRKIKRPIHHESEATAALGMWLVLQDSCERVNVLLADLMKINADLRPLETGANMFANISTVFYELRKVYGVTWAPGWEASSATATEKSARQFVHFDFPYSTLFRTSAALSAIAHVFGIGFCGRFSFLTPSPKFSPCNLILQGHTSPVLTVAWSPDGKRIASGSDDKTVRIWDSVGGKELQTLSGHTAGVKCVAWSANGQRLASGDSMQTALIWDVEFGKLIWTFKLANCPSFLALSADGLRIACGFPTHEVQLWDVTKGTFCCLRSGRQVDCLAWSCDGQWLVTGSARAVCVWNTNNGEILWRRKTGGGAVYSVRWSSGERDTVIGTTFGQARTWDAENGRLLRELRNTLWNAARKAAGPLRWDSNDQWLAHSDGDSVQVFQAECPREHCHLVGHTKPVKWMDWSADGQQLATCSDDMTLRIWDIENAQPEEIGEEGEESMLAPEAVAFHQIHSLTWSPDGRLIATGGDDELVKVWNAERGKLVRQLNGHSQKVNSVAWSIDGKWLASGSDDKSVMVWDTSCEKAQSLQGYTGAVYVVAWNPEGYLASGGRDGICIWMMESNGKWEQILSISCNSIRRLSWSPSGQFLASNLKLYEFKILSLEQIVCQPFGYTVESVAWSPNSEQLVIVNYSELQIWDVKERRVVKKLNCNFTNAVCSTDGNLVAGCGRDFVQILNVTNKKGITIKCDGVRTLAWNLKGRQLAVVSEGGRIQILYIPDPDRFQESYSGFVNVDENSPLDVTDRFFWGIDFLPAYEPSERLMRELTIPSLPVFKTQVNNLPAVNNDRTPQEAQINPRSFTKGRCFSRNKGKKPAKIRYRRRLGSQIKLPQRTTHKHHSRAPVQKQKKA